VAHQRDQPRLRRAVPRERLVERLRQPQSTRRLRARSVASSFPSGENATANTRCSSGNHSTIGAKRYI
jgi:hypothetical protein